MPLHARGASRDHRNHAVLDGGIADFPLVHEKHSPQGLEQDFRGLRFWRLQHPHQGLDLLRRQTLGSLLGAGLLHRQRDAFLVERLQEIIDRVDLERLERILVKSRGEDDLGQGNLLVEKLLDDAESVESGHLNVEEDKIGAVLFDEADGLETVFPLRYHVDVANALEQIGEFIAGELLIVHDYRRKRHSVSRAKRSRPKYSDRVFTASTHPSSGVGLIAPEPSQTTFSRPNAIPNPPLTQSVATPRRVLRFSISCNKVTVIRVPVQPMGCPIAIAPPFTFSRSRLKFNSRSQASTWAAKASFSSINPKSCSLRLCFSSSLRKAGTGPIPIMRGSTPAEVTAEIRASGFRLFCFTKCSFATITAAAPSVIPEELPAVMVPVFENTGASLPSFSMLASANGCSSRLNVVVPFLPSIVTGTSSASNRPAAIARPARVCDISAYSSCSSREIL